MSVTVIVGMQRGDEGKGRYVDLLMPEHDIGARWGGGKNAGHTVLVGDTEYNMHALPTSVIHPHAKSVMGRGMVIDPVALVDEMQTLSNQGVEISPDNLLIDSAAHLILPSRIFEDEIREAGSGQQGSTKSGIAHTYAAKHVREDAFQLNSIKNRIDVLAGYVTKSLIDQAQQRSEVGLEPINEEEVTKLFIDRALVLGKFITDTVPFFKNELTKARPSRVLAEGAQAFWLDIDHGMFPSVTSSSTTSGGVTNGLGIPISKIDRVIGVVKAVPSHVGGGPFVTQIHDETKVARLRGSVDSVDGEYGTTTGRPRRVGYLDLPQLERALWVNDVDEIALTKLDKVPEHGEENLVCTKYRRKGKELSMSPDAEYKLEQSSPEYELHPTWTENIQGVRKFEDLPTDAQHYVDNIEDKTGVRVSMIGVGPDRDQVIIR